jgi:hypothetical protein
VGRPCVEPGLFKLKGAWINVDTTFGTIANYFDSSNFNVDHKYAQIQGSGKGHIYASLTFFPGI